MKSATGSCRTFLFHDLETDLRLHLGGDCLRLQQFCDCGGVGGFIDLDSMVRCVEP